MGVFASKRSNFNYFGHFYNYVPTIENFIMLVGWILNIFSSMNILIHPISCISNQISRILKVLYDDLGVYFNVCIIFIFMINIYINYGYVCISFIY